MQAFNDEEDFVCYHEDENVVFSVDHDEDTGDWCVFSDPEYEAHLVQVEMNERHAETFKKMAIELSLAKCGDCHANPCECGAHLCVIGNLRVEQVACQRFLDLHPCTDASDRWNVALPLYCGGMVLPCKPNAALVNAVYQTLRAFLVSADDRVEVISKLMYFCTYGSETAVPLMRSTKLGPSSTACLVQYRGAWVVGVENASNVCEYNVVREPDFRFNESEIMILANRLDTFEAVKQAGFTQFLQYVVLERVMCGSELQGIPECDLPYVAPVEHEYRFRDAGRSCTPLRDVGVVRRNLRPYRVKPKNFEALTFFPFDVRVAMCHAQCQKIEVEGSKPIFFLGGLEDPASLGVTIGHHLGLSLFRQLELKAAKCERFELVIALRGGSDRILVRRCDSRYDNYPHYYPLTWHQVDSKGAVVYRAEFGSSEPGIYSVSWCGIHRFFEIADKNLSPPLRTYSFVPIVAFVRDSSVPFCRRPRDSPLSIGVFEPASAGRVFRRLASLEDEVDPAYESVIYADRDGTPVLYNCTGVVYLGLAPRDETRCSYDELNYSELDPAVCYVDEPDDRLAGHSPEVYPAEVLTGIMSEAMECGELDISPSKLVMVSAKVYERD